MTASLPARSYTYILTFNGINNKLRELKEYMYLSTHYIQYLLHSQWMLLINRMLLLRGRTWPNSLYQGNKSQLISGTENFLTCSWHLVCAKYMFPQHKFDILTIPSQPRLPHPHLNKIIQPYLFLSLRLFIAFQLWSDVEIVPRDFKIKYWLPLALISWSRDTLICAGNTKHGGDIGLFSNTIIK